MCGEAESSGRQEISSKSDLTVQSVFVWDVWMSTDRGMGVCDCVSACEKGGGISKSPYSQSHSLIWVASNTQTDFTKSPTVLWNASSKPSPECR